MKIKSWIKKVPWKTLLVLVIAAAAMCIGSVLIWVSTFKIPDIDSLRAQVLSQSTKIYDRTGNVLLYDLNPDVKRTIIPFDEISQNVKNATVAIEDPDFYNHKGIKVSAILRAVFIDLTTFSFEQGGSTITQQVIKNSLLTADKTITRKIKEWVLALRLEQIADKDTILNLYLNSIPYGGNHYGIEEASQAFFAKHASDLDIAEAAYLAAIPQAPTHYSPFGKYVQDLENRKNLVLKKMLENKSITQDDYNAAIKEKVTFQTQNTQGIKAPHFVMYIKAYLEDKYGEEKVQSGGLKVITTLDYDMQQKGEEVAKKYALQNEKNYNASNDALVAIDPKTGQILTMVGSRDYFDKKIEGNFNVAIAPNRQPGSTFKPFVYAEAFNLGYTPDTILFDTKTQFSSACNYNDQSNVPPCYSPSNYDNDYRGPISIRNALGGSINIPAIKALYLVGINKALSVAKDMGITSLNDPNRYGLTLVLGGGEVSPLEMTSAYSVFANTGVRNPYTGILSVQDAQGNVLEQFEPHPVQVLPEQTALQISDILSDQDARASEYSADSPLNFRTRDVAVKTGTTNNFVDAWIIGYTPSLAVGAWAGNNDNKPMQKKIAGFIVAPMWRAFMDAVLPKFPDESFQKPEPISSDLKPILRGIWQGGQTYFIDKTTGLPATDSTAPENKVEQVVSNVHDILYWVNKNDPTGPQPDHPENDSQFASWEFGVQQWLQQHNYVPAVQNPTVPTTSTTNSNGQGPSITIISPTQNSVFQKNDRIFIAVNNMSAYPLKKLEYFINNVYIGTSDTAPFNFSFSPSGVSSISTTNVLRVVAYDSLGQQGQNSISFNVNQ